MKTIYSFLFCVLFVGLSACTTKDPTYCDETVECPAGEKCLPEEKRCIPVDAGVEGDLQRDIEQDDQQNDGIHDDQQKDSGADQNQTDLENGESCSSSNACKSGFCVDGVCCEESSCDECNRCNVSGKEGICQPADEDLACGLAESCTNDIAKTPTCKSGQCILTDKKCEPYACDNLQKACATTCSSNTECSSNAYCDLGLKQCVLIKNDGASCVDGAECQSGYCVDGVCCMTSSCDACQACNISGHLGSCFADSSKNNTSCKASSCIASSVNTNAEVFAQYKCNNGSCDESKTECNAFTCDKSAGCGTSCLNDTNCIDSGFCDQSQSPAECAFDFANGSNCDRATQCQSGVCTASGYCCDQECDYACSECSTGTCTALPINTSCGTNTKTCRDTSTQSYTYVPACNGTSFDCEESQIWDCGNFRCDSSVSPAVKCLDKCSSLGTSGHSAGCQTGSTCEENVTHTQWGDIITWVCK